MRRPSSGWTSARRVIVLAAITVVAAAMSVETPALATPATPATPGGWAQVGTGGAQTCGVRTDGTLWCWGANSRGQLGIGNTTDQSTPTQVGTATDWVSVTSGDVTTCALTSEHTIWCFGGDDNGVLGDGVMWRDSDVPVEVVGAHDWASVSAGLFDVCAIDTDGALWCWGWNTHGTLGIGAPKGGRARPTRVGTASDWLQVSGGWADTCGIRASHLLYCWGYNGWGGLGTGDQKTRRVPVQVSTSTHFSQVSVGWDHTCGIGTRGAAYCWGRNLYGAIGDGTTVPYRLTPTQAGTSHDWQSVSASDVFTCGLRTNHTRWCWGSNAWGSFGDGTTTNQTVPKRAKGADWQALSNSGASCGIRSGQSLWCWGENDYGEVGNGTTVDQLLPVRIDVSA